MAKIKMKASKTKKTTEEEIRSIAHNISDAYLMHRRQFNVGLLIAAVVLSAALIYSLVMAGKETSAGMLFENAYASLSDTTGTGPNYDKALQGFQEIVKQYGGTMNGAIAQLYVGNTLLQMGKTDDALHAYRECAKRYGRETFVMGLVHQRMGYIYVSQGKLDDAVKEFQQAEEHSGGGVAMLELARLFEQSGKTKEAMEKYKELAEKIPATTWAMNARAKLPPPDLSAPKSAPVGTLK